MKSHGLIDESDSKGDLFEEDSFLEPSKINVDQILCNEPLPAKKSKADLEKEAEGKLQGFVVIRSLGQGAYAQVKLV